MTFARFVGIDWSGAKGRHQKGLQVAIAEPGRAAPNLFRERWSRDEVVAWIAEEARNSRTLFGLDFAFQFPAVPGLPGLSWADVETVCAAAPNLYGGAFFEAPSHPFRDHVFGRSWKGPAFDRRLMRLTEIEAARLKGASPSTVFLAIGPAQVGPSSISGMRALHRLSQEERGPCIWPFEPDDGRRSVVLEIFPRYFALMRAASPALRKAEALDAALAAYGSDGAAQAPRSEDEGDAILAAAALRALAGSGPLPPVADPRIRREGWIFGVPLPMQQGDGVAR